MAGQAKGTGLFATESWQPARDLLRRVAFRRDSECRRVERGDLVEALRFADIREDARRALEELLDDSLPEPADEAELEALFEVVPSSAPLALSREVTNILREMNHRFDDFLTVRAPAGPRSQMQRIFKACVAAAMRSTIGIGPAVEEGAFHLASQLADRRGATAALLIHGADESGTLELARGLAQGLAEWRGYQIQDIDLARFRGNEADSLVGWESVWTGSRPGRLTQQLFHHPQTVVILRNADRAGPSVLSVLETALIDGYLLDKNGITKPGETRDPRAPREETRVDCSRAVFIALASEGAEHHQHPELGKILRGAGSAAREAILDCLRSAKSDESRDAPPRWPSPILNAFSKALVLVPTPQWGELREAVTSNLSAAALAFEKQTQCPLDLGGFDTELAHIAMLSGTQLTDVREAAPEKLMTRLFQPLLVATIRRPAGQGASAEARISITAPHELAAIVDDLGADPAAQLSRLDKRLTYRTTVVSSDDGSLVLEFSDFELVRQPRFADHLGTVHVLPSIPECSLDDVAGHAPVKRVLRELAGLMKDRSSLAKHSNLLPRGMLFWGAPGTGKTLLARGFAGEADLPFVATTGSDLLRPENIESVYRLAKRYAPCVVLIDEADALGRRGTQSPLHDVAINKLLTELDGFHNGGPVLHLFISNRPQALDDALLRPGRIDRHYHIAALTAAERAPMIERLMAAGEFSPALRDDLSDLTEEMTGAEIAGLVRDAGLERLTRGKALERRDVFLLVRSARGRSHFAAGPQVRGLPAAIYIAGRASVLLQLAPDIAPVAFSIEDGELQLHGSAPARLAFATREHMSALVTALLAGRAAERLLLGDPELSMAAGGDLQRATQWVWHALASAGLDDACGPLPLAHGMPASTAGAQIGAAARRAQLWLATAEQDALALIGRHQMGVRAIADELLNDGFTTKGRALELLDASTRIVRGFNMEARQ